MYGRRRQHTTYQQSRIRQKPDSELVADNLETSKATLSKAGRADYVVVADRALAGVKNMFLLDSKGTKLVASADDDDCYTRQILGTSLN